jgi:hypothetical protein
MRLALVASTLLLAGLAALPAEAQQRRQQSGGMVIEVKPRSWLDAGTSVEPGRGLHYVRDTSSFGGGPVYGISSRGESNLPQRGVGSPLFTFEFLGANVNR